MNVNNQPQVRLPTSPETSSDLQAVNNFSDRRTGGNPLLRANHLINLLIFRGVVGLAQVYERYKNSSQEPATGPSKSEQFFNNHQREIDHAQRLLEIALPQDFRPFVGATKNTASTYFALKVFLRGGAINPDSVKYTAYTTGLAGILHAATFYPGSRGQSILDRVQLTIDSSFSRPPALARIRPNAKDFTKMLMVMVGGMISKEYTKHSSYSRLQLPQTESSEKLLRSKDEMNLKSFLRDYSCISIMAAMLLRPTTKQKIGSALSSLVRNPTELYKSLSVASVPALVVMGTGMWAANRMRQSSHRADVDTLLVTPYNR